MRIVKKSSLPFIRKQHPVDAFANVAHTFKVIQFLAFAWWYSTTGDLVKFNEMHIFRWLVGLLLVGFGQLLNISIYQAIGKAGVYYGTRLGVKVPWCTGFPFNFIAHPQYVGAVVSWWGIAIIFYTSAHWEGLVVLSLAYALLYSMNAYVEAKL
eukprot:TRINITY_DN19544_c0_g1_i8.p1 TRINITY_DN19544_c0_g1~~TRINITY_DN19544_c0_g1_i8.p1  ORF type:complete len:154 (-),score=3.32 TRINITY_DN19544_c0_g1_i8:82-543(-)